MIRYSKRKDKEAFFDLYCLEKVRIPVMDWLGVPINMWMKNSRSLLGIYFS